MQHTHNQHAQPSIMASFSSASDWECGACTSSNKGGKYCTMCATPCPKRQAVLATLAVDVAVPPADGYWACGGGEGDSVCANAWSSCWCARVGGKEGKGIEGECCRMPILVGRMPILTARSFILDRNGGGKFVVIGGIFLVGGIFLSVVYFRFVPES